MSLIFLSEAEREVYQDMVDAPGRFDNCPAYVPFYRELAMLECANETRYTELGESVDIFHLTETDWQAWPELQGIVRLYLWERADHRITYHTENVLYAGEFSAALDSDAREAGESLSDFAARAVLDAMADADDDDDE
jgi:hypothetical protein